MSNNINPPNTAETQVPDSQPKRYQHPTATRIVPMQRDHLGQPFWESYLTPAGFEVRAECQIPPHMPGVIIFVHGVNSEGEWYDDAEQALCEGLNDRLHRTDGTKLVENRYITVDKATKRQIPRLVDPEWNGHSPVIRFYWGYRAPDGREKKWRIPLRNRGGADLWDPQTINQKGPWYWGGGPFQNGTNNLPQLWSQDGIKRRVNGFDLEQLNTEADRELQDAPPREYYTHAAQRLADLIDRIRRECPRDTITVMSHSQGTMIALAATALCKKRAPDALFVMNSPYALEDKFSDTLAIGDTRPTTAARINTFRNIANRIKRDKRIFTDAEIKQLRCGASEDMDFWRPDNQRRSGVHERDNHGRLYVYFNPHDRVMGASPLQSVGWQGVNDKLLTELGDTVKQRMLARSTPVGNAPGIQKFGTLPPIEKPVPYVDPKEFWNGNRNVFTPIVKLWAVPKPNQTVTLNAEQVEHPLTAEEMKSFEESRKEANPMAAIDPDTGEYVDKSYRYFRYLYEQKTHPVLAGAGVAMVPKTKGVVLKEHDEYRAEPTNHSTLPMHQSFMRRVVAYDLPIGFCDAHERWDFWASLMKQADWTLGHDPYFETGKLAAVEKPTLIDWQSVAHAKQEADQEAMRQQIKFGAGLLEEQGKEVVYGD